MSLFAWCTRRSGGLAMIATLVLSYWVVSKEAAVTHHDLFKYQHRDSITPVTMTTTASQGAGMWTVVFAYYCLLIHVLVAIFPLRSCWAVWDMTSNLRKSAHSKALQNLKFAHRRRGSSTSLSSSETLTSSHGSSTSSEAGDFEAELYTDADSEPDRVVHAIVIPNYKEELDTLRETLEVLGSHPQARNSYDVSLACPPIIAQQISPSVVPRLACAPPLHTITARPTVASLYVCLLTMNNAGLPGNGGA